MIHAKPDWEELSTPCFLIHGDEFREAMQEFKEALSECFPTNILGYSVKTNHTPYLLETVRQCGHYAEVVSADEYHLARKLGFEPIRIIYNGPMKDKATFREAVQQGAMVNIETKRELQWLAELPWTMHMRVGLRLAIPAQVAKVDDGQAEGSRFGFSLESGEFAKALQDLHRLGFESIGIHAHHTTHTRSLAYYEAVCCYVGEVARQLQWQPSYIDMGGGYYGRMPGKPTYTEYMQTMHKALVEYLPMERIPFLIEPGNAVVASVVDYICEVIDVKDGEQEHICTTDGSRIDVDPLWHKDSYQTELAVAGEKIYHGKQLLTGCTCKEDDRLMSLSDAPELVVGDKILCRWQGAYTMALSPLFIRQLCNVYVEEQGCYRLAQSRWGADDWLRGYQDRQPEVRIMFSNAGRRAKLIQDFRTSLGSRAELIATDNWSVAPALFQADRSLLVPKWTEPDYMDKVMELCKQEHIDAILTCVDPEIDMLAAHKDELAAKGIMALVPSLKTAKLCFDKYAMYQYLTEVGIPTPRTWASLDEFRMSTEGAEVFPVFVKPRTGSGSVGIAKCENMAELKKALETGGFDYIIQEFMSGEDLDADVYIDALTGKAVAAFSKRKIETRIGGAAKTISFKDKRLFAFIRDIVDKFEFCGPVDMDFFYQDGKYYLSEVNPRFGGAYLHAFGAGVDFPRLIMNNLAGKANDDKIGNYEEGVLMMMYDDVVITNKDSLLRDYRD